MFDFPPEATERAAGLALIITVALILILGQFL